MKYFQLLQKISNFVFLGKQPHVPSYYNLQSPVDFQISKHLFKQKRDCKTNREMGKSKTNAIQADLGIFTHFPEYSGIFRHVQTYSGIFRHIQELLMHILNPLKPWYIQNPGICSAVPFKTSTRLSVSLKKVYENMVCKKHGIFTGVWCD